MKINFNSLKQALPSFFSKKGFLFTVSAVLFASTLIFFAMNFAQINSSSEYEISSSARPLNAIYLADNVAFNLSKVLGTSIDVNDSTKQIIMSGNLANSTVQLTAIQDYSSFLTNNYFPLTSGTESINLTSLTDGKAEVYFGSDVQADYNYSSNLIALSPLNSSSLSSIDLNIRASGALSSLVESTTGSGLTVNINYVDDANSFSLTRSVSATALSTITLVYADSSSVLSFGRAYSDRNNSLILQASPDHNTSYIIRAIYSGLPVLLPVKLNGSITSSSKDYNAISNLILQK